MFRYFKIEPFFFIVSNIGFMCAVSALNGEISPCACVFVPALYIVPSALFLDFAPMLFAVAVSAFFFEATTPVRAGSTAALWLVAAAAVHAGRFRFRMCGRIAVISLFIAANVLITLVCALFYMRGIECFSDYFSRVASDLVVSSVALIVLGRFPIAVPISMANIFGLDMSINEDEK